MRSVFSTEETGALVSFDRWKEALTARFPPCKLTKLGSQKFEASWEVAQVGSLQIGRTSFGAHRIESGPYAIRAAQKQDVLVCVLRLGGEVLASQNGIVARHQAGDIAVFDSNAPLVMEVPVSASTLRLEVPRERLERMLGPARVFGVSPVKGDQPAATLARTFFLELVKVHEALSPEGAERMAHVGVDLLVASIAERMAMDVPKSLHGIVTVQRARAFVEDRLGDSELDAAAVAAAVGVSLRWLQQLFKENDGSISHWIWKRRLEVAAQRLADPGQRHVPMGVVAYGCGFVNQAHFSRRFHERYGVSPREFRERALLPRGDGPAGG